MGRIDDLLAQIPDQDRQDQYFEPTKEEWLTYKAILDTKVRYPQGKFIYNDSYIDGEYEDEPFGYQLLYTKLSFSAYYDRDSEPSKWLAISKGDDISKQINKHNDLLETQLSELRVDKKQKLIKSNRNLEGESFSCNDVKAMAGDPITIPFSRTPFAPRYYLGHPHDITDFREVNFLSNNKFFNRVIYYIYNNEVDSTFRFSLFCSLDGYYFKQFIQLTNFAGQTAFQKEVIIPSSRFVCFEVWNDGGDVFDGIVDLFAYYFN